MMIVQSKFVITDRGCPCDRALPPAIIMSSTSTEVTFLDRISHNLRLIGAVSLDEFLALPARPVPDVPEPSYAILQFPSTEQNAQPTAVSHKASLGKLYEACQTAFPGSTNILQFSYTAEGALPIDYWHYYFSQTVMNRQSMYFDDYTPKRIE